MTAAHDTQALARAFHDTYERLAPSFGYETRSETRKFDPESANGKLMIAVVSALASRLQGQEGQPALNALLERAAWICKCYAEFIRSDVMSADIERHPYLPEIEGTAEDLRATLAAGSQAVQVPGWISVKDRLPAPEVFVLCWDGKNTFVDWFGSKPEDGCQITHWMPYGKPPGAVSDMHDGQRALADPQQPLAGGEVG